MALYPVILRVPPADQRPRGRAQVLALAQLARQAVARSARRSGLVLPALEKNRQGVPLASAGVFWSLTHKPLYVGGVVASARVGIDLEPLRTVDEKLTQRIGCDAEWEALGGRTPERFFRLWTAKEAVLKAVGVGMTGLSRCRLQQAGESENDCLLRYEDQLWPVTHLTFDGHIAAITGSRSEVRWDVC